MSREPYEGKKGFSPAQRKACVVLALCALGACLGFGAGMLLFRHKIRKKRFTLSMPLFILLHLILVWILLKY